MVKSKKTKKKEESLNKKNLIIYLGVILLTIILLILAFSISNNEKTKNSKKFKESYVSINGKIDDSKNKIRTVRISENNPFVYITGEELVKKINSNETFYVYFGSKYCPWCRSVIEKAIEVANDKNIKTIYYVEIWGKQHEEIFRDKYELLENGALNKVYGGTKAYKKIIKSFENVLEDYTLSKEDGTSYNVGEKRIFAPTFIYVKDGKAVKSTDGTSKKQESAFDKLTKEILDDEEKLFNEFFEN